MEQLKDIIQEYLNYCGNNNQICGLNTRAREAIRFIETDILNSLPKLKPCPFCGGNVKKENDGFYYCTTPCCFLRGVVIDVEYLDRWNSRPLEDVGTAEIERLKNKVSNMHFDLYTMLDRYKAELCIVEK